MIQDGVNEDGSKKMAPFKGDEATEVLSTLLEARNWAGDLARLIPDSEADRLVRKWSEVKTVNGFQEFVVKPFLSP